MSKFPQFILRGLQFLWTLLIMVLTGNMISLALGGNHSIVNYSMFVSVFSMLTLLYQFAALHSEGFQIMPILPLAIDGLNTLFFLIGGIALAAWLHVDSCGNSAYVNSNTVINNSFDNVKRCHEGQAVCAFLWFGFAAYAGSLVFSGLGGGSSSVNLRGGIGGIRRGGGPSMSQV